jgi:hypothetical protein
MGFKLGDTVTWTSQAQGSEKTKIGVVVEVVPENKKINTWLARYEKYLIQFGMGRRNHESYLVEVRDGKTDKARPKLYWPLVSKLREVDE